MRGAGGVYYLGVAKVSLNVTLGGGQLTKGAIQIKRDTVGGGTFFAF